MTGTVVPAPCENQVERRPRAVRNVPAGTLTAPAPPFRATDLTRPDGNALRVSEVTVPG